MFLNNSFDFFFSLSLNGSIDDASSLSCSFEARFYGAFDEASSSSAFSIGFGTEGERERKRARVRTLVLLFGFEFCLSLKIPPTKKGERFSRLLNSNGSNSYVYAVVLTTSVAFSLFFLLLLLIIMLILKSSRW